jgi:hypothetical protein
MAFLDLIPHLSLKSGEVAPPPVQIHKMRRLLCPLFVSKIVVRPVRELHQNSQSPPRTARRETLRSNSSLEDRP